MTSLKIIFILTLILRNFVVESCMAGGRTSMRSYSGRYKNREPLIYGQYIPNRSELSLAASGPTNGKITRGSPRFTELLENHNTDIVFKDEERTGADRIMTQRCKDKLDSLAIMVMNQWPGVKLRVTEGWDEDGQHAADSLHYEGRAVDISTSDRDKKKLSLLGRLAYDAGFDYVSYESRHHIHCSVRSDKDYFGASSGCFASDSLVHMADGSFKSIQDLRINDQVRAISSETGGVITDTVFMFLDRNSKRRQTFVKVHLSDQTALELTQYHLMYVLPSLSQTNSSNLHELVNVVYAKDVTTDHHVVRYRNGSLERQKVQKVSLVHSRGFYAPVTLSGNIIVNGVVSSCYALINSQYLAHVSLKPMRLLFYISNQLNRAFDYPLLDLAPIFEYGDVHWYGLTLSRLFYFLLPT